MARGRVGAREKVAECRRCGCVFSFEVKPEKEEPLGSLQAATVLGGRVEIEHGPVDVACPACGYLPEAVRMCGRVSSTMTFLFLAIFPVAALIVVKGIAANRDLDVPPALLHVLSWLCEAFIVGFAGLAGMAALYYHPSRAPFSRWSQQATVVREGRPREAWTQLAEERKDAPVQVHARETKNVDDEIAPPDLPADANDDDEDPLLDGAQVAMPAAQAPHGTHAAHAATTPRAVANTTVVPPAAARPAAAVGAAGVPVATKAAMPAAMPGVGVMMGSPASAGERREGGVGAAADPAVARAPVGAAHVEENALLHATGLDGAGDDSVATVPLSAMETATPLTRPGPSVAAGGAGGEGAGSPGKLPPSPQPVSDHVILECPSCHKRFRAPRFALQKMPRCKYCQVKLEDTFDL